MCVCVCVYFSAGLRSGDIRLVTNSGLTGVNVGRLEIFYNGQWGTVCENGFGQEEGTVVCQHLGWEVAIGYGRVRNFGYVSYTLLFLELMREREI